jgi:hypothetical protein
MLSKPNNQFANIEPQLTNVGRIGKIFLKDLYQKPLVIII